MNEIKFKGIPEPEGGQGIEIAANRELGVAGFRVEAEELGWLDYQRFINRGGEILPDVTYSPNEAQAIGGRPGQFNEG